VSIVKDAERPEGYGLRCPWCGEWITPSSNDTECKDSLLPDKRHPFVVFDASAFSWPAPSNEPIKMSEQRDPEEWPIVKRSPK
jgi:hypothetical protein